MEAVDAPVQVEAQDAAVAESPLAQGPREVVGPSISGNRRSRSRARASRSVTRTAYVLPRAR